MARPKSGGQVPLLLKNISQISYNIICKNARINPNNQNTLNRVFFLYAQTREGVKSSVASDTDDNG